MIDKKYLDPETNPAIPSDTEPDKSEDPKTGIEAGLPFVMAEKIDAGDLAKRIKSVFPKQPEIHINDGMSLVVQTSGDVEIIKPAKGKQGWDHTPLEKGSPDDLVSIKKVVDDKQK